MFVCIQDAMTSLYDALSTCATRCYLCHVTVEMSHLRQVKIAVIDDAGDWLIVGDSVENCSLLRGDRSVLFKHFVAHSTWKCAYTQNHNTKDILQAMTGWYSATTYITQKKIKKKHTWRTVSSASLTRTHCVSNQWIINIRRRKSLNDSINSFVICCRRLELPLTGHSLPLPRSIQQVKVIGSRSRGEKCSRFEGKAGKTIPGKSYWIRNCK